MKTKLPLIACLLCLGSWVNAQTSIFTKTFNGVAAINNVDVTSDGGYIVSGIDNSVANPTNVCLIKTDAAGTVQWARSYGDGIKSESAKRLIQTKDGGFLMVNSNGQYVFTIKTDSKGMVVWSNFYQTLSSINVVNQVNDIVELPDSSVIMCGSAANGYSLLFKIDKNGNTVWGNHQGNTNIILNKILRLSSGDLMVTGSSNNVFYAARLNSTGTVTWARTFSVMGTVGKTMIQSSDGNFVYVGSNGNNTTMMKTDINSNVYWAKSYNTSSILSSSVGLVETPSGGYMFQTYANSWGQISVVTDNIGNTPTARYISFGSNANSNNLKLTPDGGYVFATLINLVKMNSAGVMCSATNFTVTATGIAPTYVAVSPIYNTYMGTVSNQNFYDYAIPVTIGTNCGGKCNTGDNLSAAFSMPDSVCQGSNVVLSFNGSGASTYNWSENGLIFSTSSSVARKFNVPGTYKIKLAVYNGSCMDSTSKYITVKGNCGTNGTSVGYFQKTYTNLTNAIDLNRCSDNGFVITGGCNLLGTPDMTIVKMDSTGVVQWGRSYGSGSLNEYGKLVRQVTDGGYIVMSDNNYAFTVKVNASGAFVWENNYQTFNNTTGATSQTVRDMIATADTGVIAVGQCNSGTYGMLFKINGNGSVGWASHKSNANLFSIIPGPSGDYMVSGQYTSNSTPLIMRVSNTGTIIWSNQYSSMNLYSAERIMRTSDGNYVALCNYQSVDIALMKIDANGNLLWVKRLGGTGNPAGKMSMYEDKDRGIILVAYGGSWGLEVFKLDALGNPVDQRYFTSANSNVSTVCRMNDGSYAFSEGSAVLRKFTAFNQLASCNTTAFSLTQQVLGMQAPTPVTLTPNTYSQPNNQFYIPNNTNHALSTACSQTGCNLSASFNAPLSACVGQTVALNNTSIGGVTYTWSENSNPFSNSFSTTRSFSAVGTYNIQLQVNGNGCSGSMSINIVVSNQPTANAGNNTTISCGGNTVLTGSGGTTYTWAPTTGLSNPYIAGPTASPSTTTAYTLTASNSGCTSTASVLISVSGTPTVTGAGGGAICFGKSANLSVSGTASTYTWYPGGMTGTSVTVNPTVTTTYTVQGYVGGNCYGYDLITVVVNPLPAVPTITQIGNYLQSSAATSYQWYLNGSLLSGAVNQTYTFTQNGNYTVVITDNNGCTNTSAIFVVTTTGIDQQAGAIGSVSIFPNPTPGTFNIETTFGNGESVDITLSNMLGEVLQVIEHGTISGYYKKQVNTENLSTGIYLLTIRTASGNVVRKVVKQD